MTKALFTKGVSRNALETKVEAEECVFAQEENHMEKVYILALLVVSMNF